MKEEVGPAVQHQFKPLVHYRLVLGAGLFAYQLLGSIESCEGGVEEPFVALHPSQEDL